MNTADLDIAARTVYGEARGEGWKGKVAVAWVIKNRSGKGKWWGHTIGEVCKYPYQFSAWLEGDPNRELMENTTLATDGLFRECLAACAAAFYGLEPDPTEGACWYMTQNRRLQGWPSSWGDPKEPCVAIGHHLFYNDAE